MNQRITNEQPEKWRELVTAIAKWTKTRHVTQADVAALSDALIDAADACDRLQYERNAAVAANKAEFDGHKLTVADNTKLRELLATVRSKLQTWIDNPYSTGFVSMAQDLRDTVDAALKEKP